MIKGTSDDQNGSEGGEDGSTKEAESLLGALSGLAPRVIGGLSPRHLKLIQFLADPNDHRSKNSKAQEAGFGYNYVYELQRKEDFREALSREIAGHDYVQRASVRARLQQWVDHQDPDVSLRACELLAKIHRDIGSGQATQINILNNNDGFPERLHEWNDDRNGDE